MAILLFKRTGLQYYIPSSKQCQRWNGSASKPMVLRRHLCKKHGAPWEVLNLRRKGQPSPPLLQSDRVFVRRMTLLIWPWQLHRTLEKPSHFNDKQSTSRHQCRSNQCQRWQPYNTSHCTRIFALTSREWKVTGSESIEHLLPQLLQSQR